MKVNPLAKNYGALTPEERWRLMLAASARNDQIEREQLVQAAGRITLSMNDHAPYAHAFDELAKTVFIVVLEDAALYFEAFERRDEQELEESEEGEESECNEDADPEESLRARCIDLLLAFGYMLKANVEGWKLFCEKLNIPPFMFWEDLPGFERLQIALTCTERVAFTPEGYLKWLNRIRPKGEPELSKVPLVAEEEATRIENVFRQRVRWWSGEKES